MVCVVSFGAIHLWEIRQHIPEHFQNALEHENRMLEEHNALQDLMNPDNSNTVESRELVEVCTHVGRMKMHHVLVLIPQPVRVRTLSPTIHVPTS